MTLSDFRYLAADPINGFTTMGYNPEIGTYTIIGSQQWEISNLDVTTYRDGTLIPQITDPAQWVNQTTGAWCYYDNNSANNAIYGKLYNWYAVAGVDGTGVQKKLAPDGYHVPTAAEWATLVNTLGGEDTAGASLKDIGTTYWNNPNEGATNSSGFTARPGGYRANLNNQGLYTIPNDYTTPNYYIDYDGTFNQLGNYGYWYNATEYLGTNGGAAQMAYNTPSVTTELSTPKATGFSVRLIKDRASTETVLLYNLDASGTARIEAVAINTANYNLRELDRVTMINLSPSGSVKVINIPVSDADVPYRRIEKNLSGEYYIYAISPPSQQPIVTKPVSGSTGTATGGTLNTITTTQSYKNSTLTGFTIKLTSGTGAGQVRTISANSGTSITVSPDWTTQPIAGTVFAIFGIPQYYTNLYIEYLSTALKHQGVDYELLANIDKATESTSIYTADKSTQSGTGDGLISSRTSPINLSSILSGDSPLASVQDSNYSSVAWRSSRYDGSTMTPNRNQGYPPFTHGSFVEGAFFSKDIEESYINNLITTNTIEYKQYFSLTDLPSPQFVVEDINLKTTTDSTISGSILQLKTNETTRPTKDIAIGDILVVLTENQSSIPTERLRVAAPNPPALYTPYEFRIQTATVGEFSSIKVTRGYADTTRDAYPISSSLSRVVPVRILELANSKLTAVVDGKFKIKGREDTLYLSVDGYVISGSGAVEA